MLQEEIVLVDLEDREIGTAEKLEAHQRGDLHRAFSVMIWDSHGRLLLQRRHIGKYHSGGLWTNSCCGHPRPGEPSGDAALRRLKEEMGFSCQLAPIGTFTYRAELGGGLIEHELVHIFRGHYEDAIVPNPKECDGFSWSSPAVIRRQIATAPQCFSAWFRKYVDAGWPISPPVEIAQ
ncbi:isopentenyl-diphosphate Delta-isomerase [Hyphomicrobium sp.]|jgi:isopentenyl-diphosphate delta-isomerase|uniref:isopentenyl-diphosphate Delta-isomerase n=1 Tax=Hyphomicrobium sp. TaxID=82 RepID=UPI002B8A869D|nr:isopentenyl-diphosphate Delta-isomerase [Hyphomicrobium sp.]HVZ05004.1 isopentenyl-diphosphate Delta-isomerase [Hyphomicrobium sp.]